MMIHARLIVPDLREPGRMKTFLEVEVVDFDPETARYQIRHGQIRHWVDVTRLVFRSLHDIVLAAKMAETVAAGK